MHVSQAARTPREELPGADILPLSRSLALAPLLFVGALIAMKLLHPALYRWLIREDGIFEGLTALVYLVATGVFISTGLMLRRRGERWLSLGHLGFAGLCFLVAMEEISWGQRIFQIESPAVFQQHNFQQETNLHNFLDRYLLHMLYIIISAAAAFGWWLGPRVLRRLPPRIGEPLRRRLPFMVPDRSLMLYFLPCLLLYIFYDYVNPIQVLIWGPEWEVVTGDPQLLFIIARDQEPIELLLALGLLLPGIMMLRQLRTARPGRT